MGVVGGAQHPGGHPPHRAHRRLALHQTAARRDEAGGVADEAAQRPGRLQSGEAGAVAVVARRPTEAFDRMSHVAIRIGVALRFRPRGDHHFHRVPADAAHGQGRSLREWLTTFHLAFVALDPFTHESAWILPTAGRVLTQFGQADVRVALLVAGHARRVPHVPRAPGSDDADLRRPRPRGVKGLGIERLPAFVHLAMDGTVEGKAEGWQPAEWQAVADHLAQVTIVDARPVVDGGPNVPAPF